MAHCLSLRTSSVCTLKQMSFFIVSDENILLNIFLKIFSFFIFFLSGGLFLATKSAMPGVVDNWIFFKTTSACTPSIGVILNRL